MIKEFAVSLALITAILVGYTALLLNHKTDLRPDPRAVSAATAASGNESVKAETSADLTPTAASVAN